LREKVKGKRSKEGEKTLVVIPAQAGIHWLQELRDRCLRRDDGKWAFFNILSRERE